MSVGMSALPARDHGSYLRSLHRDRSRWPTLLLMVCA